MDSWIKTAVASEFVLPTKTKEWSELIGMTKTLESERVAYSDQNDDYERLFLQTARENVMTAEVLEVNLTTMAREVYGELMEVDIKDDESRLEKAAHRIEANIIQKRKLPADILDVIRVAARYLARLAQHQIRSEVDGKKFYVRGESGNNPRVYTEEEMVTTREGTMWTLYDHPLRDGTLLGDATGEILEQEATFYIGQGRGMMRKGFYFRAIAEAVGGTGIVRKKLSINALEKLEKEAQKKAGRLGK